MENRSSKIVAIVALCVGVVGLSLGFAAFSNTLTISSSAEVKPDASTFNVDFSATAAKPVTTTGVSVTNASSLEVGTAQIDNTGNPTVTGLSAKFTAPGQEVVYSFYAVNVGELEAFLDSIVIGNAEGADKTIKCTAEEGTSQALVDSACNGISLTVDVAGISTTSSETGITGKSMAANAPAASHAVNVTLKYAADAARADGNFSVAFGDVTLKYESVDNQ